ncbi:MAG TPA: YpdA family putative bacillithiol disulfide reductase [Massilibacterium sp.]|nr:YpdA family putative bacillithiol disulfide reductase [Massilibacterium sp.]
MKIEDAIIVGGGPCGLSAAIELQKIGKNPLVIEKGNVVDSIYRYPTHQTFFSTSEKLAIGDVPFIIEGRKPKRNQALAYYREVVKLKEVRVAAYEKVERVKKQEDGTFYIFTIKKDGQKEVYQTKYVVIATGYYDSPNYMNVKGENLDKVFHYFKEAHPYFDKDVVVIGGKNSAIDAALELEKSGARVTVLYRGSVYSESIKPWVLPDFESLVRNGLVQMEFNAYVKEITEHEVIYIQNGKEKTIKNDFVFAMTGYHPDHSFIQSIGVLEDEVTGRPHFNNETMETNVENLFIAGVIAAGNEANEIFIENGRHHGGMIAKAIVQKEQ